MAHNEARVLFVVGPLVISIAVRAVVEAFVCPCSRQQMNSGWPKARVFFSAVVSSVSQEETGVKGEEGSSLFAVFQSDPAMQALRRAETPPAACIEGLAVRALTVPTL